MTDVLTKGLLVVSPGDGEARWSGTSRITVKARAAQTQGAFGLILSETTRGSSPPLHIHHTADESTWVISGRGGGGPERSRGRPWYVRRRGRSAIRPRDRG